MPDKNFLNAGLWFQPQSLQPMVNDATWERGLMLYRAQKVVALDIEPVRLHWQLLGEVPMLFSPRSTRTASRRAGTVSVALVAQV